MKLDGVDEVVGMYCHCYCVAVLSLDGKMWDAVAVAVYAGCWRGDRSECMKLKEQQQQQQVAGRYLYCTMMVSDDVDD